VYLGILSLRYYALESLSFLVLRFLLLAARSLDLGIFDLGHEGGKFLASCKPARSWQLLVCDYFPLTKLYSWLKFPCKIELLFVTSDPLSASTSSCC
jgi:hypothetical protein